MAKKYIDADLLRKIIVEQTKSLPREVGRGAGIITSKGYGMMKAFQIVRSIIDSLQQEQPEVDLDNEIRTQWLKCNPTDEGMGSEYAIISVEQFDAIVRHFYKLGRKQVLQEIYDGKTKPVDKITVAWFDDKGEESK